MKKFIKDFKEFINRGNVIDMAIGVIVGTAFSAIVTAFSNKIIMPLINKLLSFVGGDGLKSAYTFLEKAYGADGSIDLTNSIYIDWGAFITAIINFLIIAFTLFIILKIAMNSRKKLEEFSTKLIKKDKATRQELKEMKKLGINVFDKEKVAEFRAQKALEQQQEEEKAKRELEEKLAEEKKNNPTQQELLKEIRDLLKEKNKVE